MQYLDNQMRRWTDHLQKDVRIGVQESFRLATTIRNEVSGLPEDVKIQIVQSAGTTISLRDRLDELDAFQRWMDGANSIASRLPPEVVRAQVITQNYICFVYLGEACFKELRKCLPSGSTSKKCCKFLTDNPVRAFRNALSHSNWRHVKNSPSIEFWARKSDDKNEPLSHFEVSQKQLDFWQSLARCTGYVAFLSLMYSKDDPFWKNIKRK